MKSCKKKIYAIIMVVSLMLSTVITLSAYADTIAPTGAYGNHYKMKKAQYLYKKAGGKGGKILRTSLPKSERKNCVSNLKYAKFKKGTVITSLQEKAGWIRVTSNPKGWIKDGKNKLQPIQSIQ